MSTTKSHEAPIIKFETKLFEIGSWTILKLPKEASLKLPTRAMTMVEGTINGSHFKTLLEPDGRFSHWFRVDTMPEFAGLKAGDSVNLEIWTTKDWIEPELPKDWKKALTADSNAYELWNDITPGARWDWIRWIRAVKTTETRQKHIVVALSKLNKGMRRPCCFNRNLCSEPAVSHNWVLKEPA